jgi:hypothetical protein
MLLNEMQISELQFMLSRNSMLVTFEYTNSIRLSSLCALKETFERHRNNYKFPPETPETFAGQKYAASGLNICNSLSSTWKDTFILYKLYKALVTHWLA